MSTPNGYQILKRQPFITEYKDGKKPIKYKIKVNNKYTKEDITKIVSKIEIKIKENEDECENLFEDLNFFKTLLKKDVSKIHCLVISDEIINKSS